MLFSCLGLQSGQGALLLNIITKYSYGKTYFFVSQLILTCMVDPAITFWQLTSFPFLTLLDHICHGAKQVILWWSLLSWAQGYVLDLKATQEREHSWIIDISFPTLKCENDVLVCWLLSSCKFWHVIWRVWGEWSLFGIFWLTSRNFTLTLFYLDSGFQSIVDGKYEEWSTTELSGGARIHYIFQAIFVRSLEVCSLPW
jgi:hypothetical protein